MDPFTTGLSIGTAALGALGAIGDARRANRAALTSFERTQEAAAAEAHGLDRQSSLRSSRNNSSQRRVEGQLTVDAIARGVGMGGSTRLLQVASDAEAALNEALIVDNRTRGRASIRSGVEASRVALSSRTQSVGFAGFAGGVQGFTTGLSLGQSIETLLDEPVSTSARRPRGVTS